MTEEELVAAFQRKEQEKIENKLEEKKAYRGCLLKCAEQGSSFKRRMYFYTHYVGCIHNNSWFCFCISNNCFTSFKMSLFWFFM